MEGESPTLTSSYLLKANKFLVKISQFEFLVITGKNIFVYKLFLSLNISDFSLFFCKNCNPLKKITPSFPATPPSQSWGPVKPPPPLPPQPFKNLVGRSTPSLPLSRKWGVYTMDFFTQKVFTSYPRLQLNFEDHLKKG